MKKLYYTQSEIAELFSEETWTIRYWEQSFKKLRPTINKNGRKLYSQKNVDLFGIVKKLVREDKLSNLGVKEHLEKFFSKTSKNKKQNNEISDSNLRNTVNSNISKDEIVLSKDEFIELLQIMQMILTMIK
jgi:DNA-binding transcriptional MerR regulator